MINICFAQLASPIHDKQLVSKIVDDYKNVLERKIKIHDKGLITSVDVVKTRLKSCDIVVALVVTGGSEQLIIETGIQEKPVMYIAHKSMNSLPALLEAKPIVDKINSKSWSIFALTPEEAVDKVSRVVNGVKAALTLRGKRLGLIGGISPWLVYSKVDPLAVKEKFGVVVEYIALNELIEEFKKVSIDEVKGLAKEIVDKAYSVEVSENRVIDALRLHVALERIIDKHSLDSITIKCFDIIPILNTTACLSLGLLNDKGIVAGCEGDIPATLTMMILSSVSNKPVFMGNPSIIDKNKLLIAHCTSPMSLGYMYTLRTHFETGKGVGIASHYKENIPVTIARLAPTLDSIRVIKGVIEKGGPSSKVHCRTQIWVKTNSQLDILLDKSIGNHYVLAIGDYIEEIKAFAKTSNLEVEIID